MRISAVPEVPRPLVDALYDTALAPTHWPGALEGVTAWVGCATTSLQVRHLAHNDDGEFRMYGYEPKVLAHYTTNLWHSDPHLQHVRDLPVLEPLLSREVVSDAALRHTEYYGEFCEPQRLHDLQGVVLMRNADWAVTLANHGGVGQHFDADSCARLLAVGPYVMRAMSVAFDFSPRSFPVAHNEDLNLSVASVCVDPQLRLLDPPDAAMAAFLARPECPLDVHDGTLRATSEPAQSRLLRIVQGALHGSTPGARLGQDGSYQVVAVPSARRSAFDRTLCIRVVVSWPSAQNQVPAELASLPPGLRVVALRMADGLSDKDIAVELDITHATARTYATRVLRLLGLSSRRDLMRMR
jgi:Bacterial regulatory proteins, luxR family